MGWRSVLISQASYLKLKDGALVVEQPDGAVRVPLEDIAVLILDCPQITLSGPLLSACADHQIAVITTGENHHPNGIFLPYLPHSRALQIMHLQLDLKKPRRKRLWQTLAQQKIRNQAAVLNSVNQLDMGRKLERLAAQVKSGDSTNMEALAAQLYFPALLGRGFTRKQESRRNALLNYGYAIIRAALAKSLVSYGFVTALGLHHHNEQNSFNLADDLIEPFRPLLDHYCLTFSTDEESETEGIERKDKVQLISFLHKDIATVDTNGEVTHRTVLAACEAIVVSLQQRLRDQEQGLHLPIFL